MIKDIETQYVKLLLGMSLSCIKATALSPSYSALNQTHWQCTWEAEDEDPRPSVTHIVEPNGIPGSWRQHGPNINVVGICKMM